MRGARRMRVSLAAVGIVCVLAGLAGLLVGGGAFGSHVRGEPVFANLVGRYVGRSGAWLWPVTAVVVLLLGYAAARSLRSRSRTDRAPQIDLERNLFQGSTRLTEAAATGALTRELTSYRGVDHATAQLVGDGWAPDLLLVVHLTERADVPAVRHRIESEGLARFREALEMPELRARLTLT